MTTIESLLHSIYEDILEKQIMNYKDALKFIFELGKLINGYNDGKTEKVKEIKLKLIKEKMQEIKMSEPDIAESTKWIIEKEEFEYEPDSSDDTELVETEKDAILLCRVLMLCAHYESVELNINDVKKLMRLFGANADRDTAQLNAINFLIKYIDSHPDAKIPIHDACLFEIPTEEEKWTPEIWSTLLIKYMTNPENWEIITNIISSAHKIEENYAKEDKKKPLQSLTPQEIKSYNTPYKNRDKNPEAAKLFYLQGVPEEVFDLYLTLKPVDDLTKIPDIELQHGEFKLTRLSAMDPRAAILGYLTGCCQSLGSEGEDCARYGIEHPNGGFYVMSNSKGKIVSQFFAWRVDQHLCIDSLESCEYIFNIDANRGIDVALVEEFARAITLGNHGISAVHIGRGGRTPAELGTRPLVEEITFGPVDFGDNYRDSRRIRTVHITDHEFLCKQLGIENIENCLEQAIQNVTHVEQLLYLLKNANDETLPLFKPALLKPLQAFSRDFEVMINGDYGVLCVLTKELNPALYAKLCKLIECNKLPSEAFQKVIGYHNNIQTNGNTFITEYFNFENTKEWWKTYPDRINSIYELSLCINACETEEQIMCFSDYFTGKRFVKYFSTEAQLAGYMVQSNVTVLGGVMPRLTETKCVTINKLFNNQIKTYTDVCIYLQHLRDKEGWRSITRDFLEKNIEKLDSSNDNFFKLLIACRSDVMLSVLQDNILKNLDIGKGGINSVNDYYNLLKQFGHDTQQAEPIIRKIVENFDKLSFSAEPGHSFNDLVNAAIYISSHDLMRNLIRDKVFKGECSCDFVCDQFMPVEERSWGDNTVRRYLQIVTHDPIKHVRSAKNFWAVWEFMDKEFRDNYDRNEFVTSILNAKIFDIANITDDPSQLKTLLCQLDDANLAIILPAIYAKKPELLRLTLKDWKSGWGGHNPDAVKKLTEFLIDDIDFGEGKLVKNNKDLIWLLKNLEPTSATKVLLKIKDRIPLNEHYIRVCECLPKETRDVLYQTIYANIGNGKDDHGLITSYNALHRLMSLYPRDQCTALFNKFVANGGLDCDSKVMVDLMETQHYGSTVDFTDFSYSQKERILAAIHQYLAVPDLKLHYSLNIRNVAGGLNKFQCRSILQAVIIPDEDIHEAMGEQLLPIGEEFHSRKMNSFLNICDGRIPCAKVLAELKIPDKFFSEDSMMSYLQIMLDHPITNNLQDRQLVQQELNRRQDKKILPLLTIVLKTAAQLTKNPVLQEYAEKITTIPKKQLRERLSQAKAKWHMIQEQAKEKNSRLFGRVFHAKVDPAQLLSELNVEERALLEADKYLTLLTKYVVPTNKPAILEPACQTPSFYQADSIPNVIQKTIQQTMDAKLIYQHDDVMNVADITNLCAMLENKLKRNEFHEPFVVVLNCKDKTVIINLPSQKPILDEVCLVFDIKPSKVRKHGRKLEPISMQFYVNQASMQTAKACIAKWQQEPIYQEIINNKNKNLNQYGNIHFMNAIRHGQIVRLQELLAIDKRVHEPLNNTHINCATPLGLACLYDKPEVINYFIALGAKVDLADECGATPLHRAVEANHPACVLELLKHGADINREDDNGITPLCQAVQANQVEMVALLLSRGADLNAIFTTNANHLFANIKNLPQQTQVNLTTFVTQQKNPDHIEVSMIDLARMMGNKRVLDLLQQVQAPSAQVVPRGMK